MKNRVKELRVVKASELKANPSNWRLHPDHQRSAMSALLSEIGMVAAVIARETKKGELEIIDGHLRQDIAGDDEIPVLVVDLDDTEARQVLATFDPISALAKLDETAFASLLPDIKDMLDEHADLRLMVSNIHADEVSREERREEPDHHVPGMEVQAHEHVVVLARTTHEWNVLCTRLGLEPAARRNRVGVGRGITAKKLLEVLGDE